MDMWRRASLQGIISANVRALVPALLMALVSPGVLAGCRGRAPAVAPGASPAAARAAASAPATPTPEGSADRAAVGVPAAADGGSPADERPVILFVGTSLTAGFGVDPDEAFPALIQRKLDAAGLRYRVVNAGVSGETSAGAVRRIDWLLRQRVAVLVLETGANDGLRGQDPASTRRNIQAIFDAARRAKPPPKLALVAMEALPNYGEDYRRRFRAIYPELAARNGATLVPFLLEGVAGRPGLNQPDGIHPTAAGHRRVAETVWKALRPIL
jgi:acyl-CoA thioesterase-1